MKKMLNRKAIVILFLVSMSFLYLLTTRAYSSPEYFPLNENDIYTYQHHEGIEKGIVTIAVKNVRQIDSGKQFNFLWQGKYNERIQTFQSTPRGIVFYENRHLAGEPPLKVIRTFKPPLLMIPSQLKKNIFVSTIQTVYDYGGNLIDKENIEAEISFAGEEDVTVGAGEFRCLHFFIRHNYRDASGNSKHMHTYNFWIAPGVGIVKFIHAFIPFLYVKYINPADKTIMNRYSSSFVERFELVKAVIGGKTIGQ